MTAAAASPVPAAAPAPQRTVDLLIQGMHCAACAGRVERALNALPGVLSSSVSLASGRAQVRCAAAQANVPAMLAAVRKTGFVAMPDEARARAAQVARQQEELDGLRRSLWLALALTAPVFVLEMGAHMVPALHHWLAQHVGLRNIWMGQALLTTLVLFGPGRRFFALGIPALLRGAPDMHSLVALGAGAAWLYSLVATFFPGWLPPGTVHVYFEAAAVICTLILLGRLLEARARGRTSDAIRRLVTLQPPMAHVLRGAQVLDEPVARVQAGDILDVRPGERIPVDGQVLEGESYVDESMISGEPVPVRKHAGAALTGGTLNQRGALRMRAQGVGQHTVLAQIVRMVEHAQTSRLPIQALADRITRYFVPAVMALAALTALAWLLWGPQPSLTYALVNAVAVLIIACPCAMGLATPASNMVGTGRAAQMGVFFRSGEGLQRLTEVQVVALDKTGTLTQGRPELTDLHLADGFARAPVLQAIAAVEVHSEHPIAQALVRAAQAESRNPQHSSAAQGFESLTGLGACARVAWQGSIVPVQVGSARYMQQLGLDTSQFAAAMQELAAAGKTPLFAAIDGQLAALLAVADPLRPTTPEAIAALRQRGLRVVMITGDNARTAQAIARTLAIDEVVAQVLPAGKAEAVQRLRAAFGSVAYVGDGINDAPALAQADVGIAIGSGTDIAISAADVVLMTADLRHVARAQAIARATLRNIRQNLFWAFAYNSALIPLAAGVLYPFFGVLLSPMLAAAAMALSSVFVLGNALRLRRVALD